MKQITMREFARLCTDDPRLHKQVLAIPGTISPEKVLALAQKNGYQILEKMPEPAQDDVVELSSDDLDAVSGGTDARLSAGRVDDWLVWLHIWTGLDDISA